MGVHQTILEARTVSKAFFGNPVLREVSIELVAGRIHALLGENGAGKSTLINLLSGTLRPDGGQILVDGRPIASLTPQEAHQLGIAVVQQDISLFHRSLLENLRYGRPEASYAEIVRAAETANAAEFIEKLPHKYDTVVGERGLTLSGGQRQAVAISRALNLNARLVIMDEPTAALAVAETRKVLQLIRRLAEGGRAVILISHNMHDVFEVADRIVVFRRGRKIAERRRSETDPEEVVSFITGAHPDVRALETQA